MTNQVEGSLAESSSWGVGLGLVSAVAYLVASLGLRSVAGTNAGMGDVDWAIWVSANKVVPVATVAWSVVVWRAFRGLRALPPRGLVLPLIATGLMMQWAGNVSFQYALSRGGLALCVPLTFATVLLSSAIVGRIVLSDPVTSSTLWAMGAMMAAVTVLSQGTEQATSAMLEHADLRTMVLGAGAACLAGIAYGAGGVMIRRCVTGEMSQSAIIAVLSTTGVVSLGTVSLLRIGPQQLLSTPPELWLRMLGAGAATSVAFFAITGAYKYLTVVKVNLLNASQAAMAAVAGVVMFGEPNTVWLQGGTALTIVGLILSARRDVPKSEEDDAAAPETLSHESRPAESVVD